MAQLEALDYSCGLVLAARETLACGDAALPGAEACCRGETLRGSSGLRSAFLASADGIGCQLF